jgi:pSer/pThr/pTyr-binding forkhead associated (FHA) protein
VGRSDLSGAKGYALKFISGKYQGGEYPLLPDKEVVIGRSSELDMVLVEDMVSRKHAVISAQQGAFYIQDLGSTNGTFVNGEKVKKTRLKEGDRILIGTSILKLVAQDKPLGDTSDAAIKANLERAAQKAAAQPQKATSMQGRLEEVPLPDLLQLFTTSKKNGVLTVESDGATAKVYLRAGKIYYCVVDDNHDPGPEQSFYRLLHWDKGAFHLVPSGNETFKNEMDQSTEGLLMEGLRRLDERRRIEKDLPPLQSSLSLSTPLSAPLRKLKPEELDVLQAVVNYGNLNAVLSRAPGSDIETAGIVKMLLQKDYIRTL